MRALCLRARCAHAHCPLHILSAIYILLHIVYIYLSILFVSMVCHFGVGQVLWLTICTAAVGFLPEGETKRKMVHNVLIHCFVFLSSALSAVINYHDIPNRPGKTGICVANHTSPIDVLVLMCDSCYSLVSSMRITCGVIKPSTFFLFFFSLRVFVCLHFPINIPLPPNLFALI